MSQRFKEEPAGEVFYDEASKVATKSAEISTQVYNSTKTKVSEFVNNGGIDEIQNKAYHSATNIGNSFWNFVCNATKEDQEKLTKGNLNSNQPKPREQPSSSKPLWGFTWGK